MGAAGCGPAVRPVGEDGGAEAVVRDFCTKFGQQRRFAFLSLFPDSARFDIEGVSVSFVGRDDIARLADYGVAVHERLLARNPEVVQDTVRCRLEESNDWLALLGVRSATYDGLFLVSGEKIARARLDLTPDSREELAGKLAGFLAWLRVQDPKALQRILPGGRPAYDCSVVPDLVGRLRQWRSREHP